jgi:hypothetical protein
LLIPASSRLLELEEVQTLIGKFDETTLAYPWVHSDPVVDRLQQTALREIRKGQSLSETRRQIFQRIWKSACETYDDSLSERVRIASLDQAPPRASVPFLTEPWYC